MLAFYEKAIEGIAAAHEESWKREHRSAIWCLEFEQLVHQANTIFADLVRSYEEIYDVIVTQECEDDDQEALVRWRKLFQDLQGALSRLISRLPIYEREGYQIAGSENLKRNQKEISRQLLTHKEFFADPEFQRFTEEAVNSHARGRTEPIVEFG